MEVGGGRPIKAEARDADLMRRVAAGSEGALGSLYDRHAIGVFRVANAINRDRDAAEEVVQETFLVLWNRAETFDPALGSLGGWLAAIARNRSLDRLRSAARKPRAASFSALAADDGVAAATVDWIAASRGLVGAARPEPEPETAVAERETGAAVVAALDVLPPLERETILLAYRDGLSQSEIATHLGWPLGTVKTRSRRALSRMREALERTPSAPAVVPVGAGRASRRASSMAVRPCALPC